MILHTLALDDFRQNHGYVEAVTAFFSTEAGKALAAVLRGCDPVETLSSPHNNDVAKIRDLSIAESANPSNLLGMAKGYRLALKVIEGAGTKLNSKPESTFHSQHSKTLEGLRQTEPEPEVQP